MGDVGMWYKAQLMHYIPIRSWNVRMKRNLTKEHLIIAMS
jgi:hypothetical protein